MNGGSQGDRTLTFFKQVRKPKVDSPAPDATPKELVCQPSRKVPANFGMDIHTHPRRKIVAKNHELFEDTFAEMLGKTMYCKLFLGCSHDLCSLMADPDYPRNLLKYNLHRRIFILYLRLVQPKTEFEG